MEYTSPDLIHGTAEASKLPYVMEYIRPDLIHGTAEASKLPCVLEYTIPDLVKKKGYIHLVTCQIL